MNKKFFQSFLVILLISGSLTASARTSYNFNSRPSVPLKSVKHYLHNHCSLFVGFDVNANGWNPNIEGDGAMVSEKNTSFCYAVSPVLAVKDNITISFNYKLSDYMQSGVRRWLKIYLADANNIPRVLLDSLEFSNINPSSVYSYYKTLATKPGSYKLYTSYNGSAGSTAIAIDQYEISAPAYYTEGCNAPPVALNDNIMGNTNRSASGFVTSNDSDQDGELFSAFLITPSPDGTVILNPNGRFSFTPNSDFAGTSTRFSYKVCDQGMGVLCSNDATVTINFPGSAGGILPESLTEFNGFYRDKGKVELNWETSFEHNISRFDVERSMDGMSWHKVGTMATAGVSSVKKSYSFTDAAGKNRAIKNDLYYRLKQVDLDNKAAYSRMMIVRVYNTESLKMISVTPNPAKNDISVNTQLNEGSYIVMKVINNAGNEVMKKSLKAGAGSSSYMLEGTSKLQPGMYMLEVIVNSKERMLVSLVKE